jgi:hypothetical protein
VHQTVYRRRHFAFDQFFGRITRTFPAVAAIDGVVIVTRPEITERIVHDCGDAGVRRVWMHQSVGKGSSVSLKAVEYCRQHDNTQWPLWRHNICPDRGFSRPFRQDSAPELFSFEWRRRTLSVSSHPGGQVLARLLPRLR